MGKRELKVEPLLRGLREEIRSEKQLWDGSPRGTGLSALLASLLLGRGPWGGDVAGDQAVPLPSQPRRGA